MIGERVNRQKKLPFALDRNDGRSLVAQLVDGFREAIVGGYYAPGDVLPSYRDLAPALDVSQIVTKAAHKRLASEGLIVSRPRIGSVVRDCGEKRWLGNIVFVYPESDISYFQTVFAEEMRSRLASAGYLMTQVRVGPKTAKGYELSLLDAALARSVDLAIVLYDRPQIFRRLASREVPYIVIGQGKGKPAGAVGFSRLDYNLAVPQFLKSCKAHCVREIVQFSWDRLMCSVVPYAKEAGFAVREVFLRPNLAIGQFAGVERAGMESFAYLMSETGVKRNTVYFLADDYLARGALTAILHVGLAAPEDVRVVTWMNKGLDIAFPRVLTQMRMDPVAAGATITKAVLAYLSKGEYPEGIVIGPKWIEGETLDDS